MGAPRGRMKIGFLGFAKVGKTTLFNLLTGAHAAVDRYGSGRAEPNVGVARVPEPRLDRLSGMFKPKKTTYAHVDFLDVAQRRLERLELNIRKAKNKDDEMELPIMKRCLEALERETPIREVDLT